MNSPYGLIDLISSAQQTSQPTGVDEMTTAHTPGEWYHVGGSDKRHAPYIRAVGDLLPGTMAIAEVCNRGGHGEHQANARLIAAAPELLIAAQMALGVMRLLDFHTDPTAERLESAIAKATGAAA